MNVCPECHRLYDEAAKFCPVDGQPLSSTDALAIPHDEEDERIGATLCRGRYQIWRRVADGGMGRVYQAVDLELGRGVAVKVLHTGVAQDQVAVERFKREYALSAELPHDHIVEVLDFQRTEDGSYALVMEYLEGEELRMFLKREEVATPHRMLRILAQLAIGLREPHSLKMVHRDIKPDNIFLVGTEEGPRVKLLDFGSVRDNSEGAKKLTVVGTTIGSPFYMSPEQAQGLPELDERADVWSIAAIAYECLTGIVPFAGRTGPAILLAILNHDPPPASVAAPERDVPHTLDDVLADGLVKEAVDRTPSVAALADRFGHALGLEGDHRTWAYMSEDDIAARIVLPPPAPAPSQEAPLAAGGSPAGAAQPSPFAEDDPVAMGVPQGPPVGLYVGLGALALAIVGLGVYFLL